MRIINNILVALAMGATAVAAQAATNLVGNGGFDGTTRGYVYNGVPSTVTQFYGGSVPTAADTVADWQGTFVSIAGSSGPWGTPGGLPNHGATSGWVAGLQADGFISQTLNLDAGTYLLTWADANRTNVDNSQHYSVSFDGVTYQSFTTTAGNGWKSESLVFTLATNENGALMFKGGTSFGNVDATSFIDNVQLSAVPEASSLMMMAVATLGLLAWRRRSQA